MGRSRDIGRTFDSGAKKRVKQKKKEEYLKKQCDALNKFPGFNLTPIISASSCSSSVQPTSNIKTTISSKDNSKDNFTFPHSEVFINNVNPSFSNISSTLTSYCTIEKDQIYNSFFKY